jgi:hypothetical protein
MPPSLPARAPAPSLQAYCLDYLVRRPGAIGDLGRLSEPLALQLLAMLWRALKLTPTLVARFRASGHDACVR